MYSIEIHKLKKYYKEVKAVDQISFKVEQGELFGFLGVNGAGKSTTINMLSTLQKPSGGSAVICQKELGRENVSIRKHIGIVYQKNCLDELLSIKDNLLIRGALYESDKIRLLSQFSHISQVLELKDILHRPFGKLSGGQKRRCEIARALMHAPKILFLDEPTTGLDPASRKTVWNCIETLRKEFDMTVFLTTHYMEEAANANHIAIIDQGIIKDFGTPFDLKDRYTSDQLIIYPSDETGLYEYLDCRQIVYQNQEHIIRVPLKNTISAISLLDQLAPYINGFEVHQGTMDDVFLNATGKALETREEL